MTKLDYILLAPIVFGIIYGGYRGFFKEMVALVCLIAAIFVSRYFGGAVAVFLSKTIGWQQNITRPVAFVLIFIASVFGLKFVAEILTKLAKIAAISWLNRLLGALLGGLKWLLITSIFLNLLSFFYQKTDLERENRLAQSKFYKPIENTVNKIIPLLHFEKFLQKHEQKTDKTINEQ